MRYEYVLSNLVNFGYENVLNFHEFILSDRDMILNMFGILIFSTKDQSIRLRVHVQFELPNIVLFTSIR